MMGTEDVERVDYQMLPTYQKMAEEIMKMAEGKKQFLVGSFCQKKSISFLIF